MPYNTPSGGHEKSRRLGQVPLVNSPVIQQKLKSYRVFSNNSLTPIDPGLLVPADSLPATDPRPRWAMSFDGSPQEVAARESYPSTRLGYLQIAGVLVDLDKMLGQGDETLVDPSIIRTSSQEALHAIVMPSSNVCRADMNSVRDSWRAEVYDIFAEYKVEDVPLLDVFLTLVGYSDKRDGAGNVVLPKCIATPSCSATNVSVPKAGTICKACSGKLFPTDSLRIYEEVSEYNSNEAALNRLMSVLEHITMLAYIKFLYQRQARTLSNVAFILDGPLAVFGPQSWLHTPIQRYLQFINDNLLQRQLRLPIIVGIEKTGQFAEHAADISENLNRRTIMRLSDDYIYERILASRDRPDTKYGRDEYYGRKFFYKTAQGQLLTIVVPPHDAQNSAKQIADDDPARFPTMPSVLSLLDKVGTSLYQNAVIPIALAHSFASIPLHTGSKVLTLLSQKVFD